MIGSHILELVQKDNGFSSIKVLVRRPVIFNDAKIKVMIIDFADTTSFKEAVDGSDVIFCAVGTTQKKVKGDKAAYRKVDFDIPVSAAKFCSQANVSQFLLVSAVGANSKSGNFYLKLKGEVEDAISKMDIPSISIFRPSMLLGERNEFRAGEKAGQALMKTFSFLLPSKYKPVSAEDVAKAMVAVSKEEKRGFHIYHYKEMMEYS